MSWIPIFGSKSFRIRDLVPKHWFSDPGQSSVWISGYRMLRIFPIDLPSGPIHLDLHGIRTVFSYGTITYLDSSAATPHVSEDGKFHMDASKVEKQAGPGAHLLLLVPFKVDGNEESESAMRKRISDVIGLLIAVNDRNMAYEHLFDYVQDVEGNERSVIGEVMVNPLAIPKPDISRAQLDFITDLDNIIELFPDAQKNRVRLSLRWYEQALRDIGANAFVKLWIAIETIAMPDTTNIKPIIKSLANSNSLSVNDAASRYQIGRLFGIRSKTVHDGMQIYIPGSVIDYMECIFIDLLMNELGRPSMGKAEEHIAKGFDPEKVLSSLLV